MAKTDDVLLGGVIYGKKGKAYRVVEYTVCPECDFMSKASCIDIRCSSGERADKKNVMFIREETSDVHPKK